MRNRLILGPLVLAAILASPSLARGEVRPAPLTFANAAVEPSALGPASRPILLQRDPSNDHDTLWNGVLIGAGVGAAVGMLIAPQAFCGGHDTECSTIVRVAIGLPAIAGGIGIGALVDVLMSRRNSPVSGVQLNWKF